MPTVSSELLAITRLCPSCNQRKLKADFKSPRSKACMMCQSKPQANLKRSPGDREDLEELHRCRAVIADFPTLNTNTSKE